MASVRSGRATAVAMAITCAASLSDVGSQAAGRESRGPGPLPDITLHTDWRTFSARDGLPHASIRVIRPFGGQLWVGTDGGLALFEDGEWQSWTRREGLPSEIVSAIDVDPETRDLWLGTWGSGLVRFSGGRFDRFDQFNSGLAGDLVFDVAVVGTRVWAATNAGISMFDTLANAWELYEPRRAHVPELAATTFVTLGGDLYVGLWQGDVKRFDSIVKHWTTIGTESRVISAEGRTTESQSRGRGVGQAVGIAVGGQSLWWATQDAVLQMRRLDLPLEQSGPWQIHTRLPAESWSYFVQCLAAPSDGQVWLGTNRGLLVLADGAANTWIHLRANDGGRGGTATIYDSTGRVDTRELAAAIPDNHVRCVAFDGDVAWVGTREGLARGDKLMPWAMLPSPVAESGPRLPREMTSDSAHSAAVAIYGPRNRTVTLPGEVKGVANEPGRPDLLAVELSVEEANARGGYRGAFPFGLTMVSPGYSRYGWGLPEDDIAYFSRKPDVLGIVGYLVKAQHVADAVVVRTEVPWLNVAPVKGGEGVATATNPWIFRCHGDEPRRYRLLFDYALDHLSKTRSAVLATRSQSARLRLDWWKTHADERGHPVVAELDWPGGARERTATLERLRRARSDVVVTLADKDTTAVILREARSLGLTQLFVVSPDCVTDDFAELAGNDPGAVIALDPAEGDFVSREDNVGRMHFAKNYTDRNVIGRTEAQPGENAYRSFAATDHLLHAVNIAGPDRCAVRDTLEALSRSSRGEAHYERYFGAVPVRFAQRRARRWVLLPLPPEGEK